MASIFDTVKKLAKPVLTTAAKTVASTIPGLGLAIPIASAVSAMTKPKAAVPTTAKAPSVTPYNQNAVVRDGMALQPTNNTASAFKTQPVPQVKTTVASSAGTPAVPKVTPTPTYSAPTVPNVNGGGSSGGSSTPTKPKKEKPVEPSATEKAVTDAEEAYAKSMKMGRDELTTQSDLDRLTDSTRQAYTGTKNKAIPLEFITGQLQNIENRALDLAVPLETRLARLEAQRTNSLESSKFALDRADTKLKAEQDAAKPISIGDSLVRKNPTTGAYETVYSAPQEGFTLGKDQVRYDSKGNIIAGSVGAGDTGASVEAQSWADLISKGQAKIGDVPSEIRSAVAAAIATGPATQTPGQKQAQEQSNTAITSIDKVLGFMESNNLLSLNTGNTAWGRVLGQMLPGSEARDLNSSLDTVKALIGFDALAKMREASPTGGALGNITERELAYLQSVQGSLDVGQSTGQLKTTLETIRQSFERLRVLSSPDTSPEEYLQKFPNATDAELEEVIQRFDQSQTQANASGNLPQRNNNPGNLKSGGIADEYATGTDSQGHLIFPDADTGFMALQQDVLAKLTGKSQHVGANPTIAQIGRVYAEDPNWSAAVSKMLGVSPSTPASQVDFDSLIYAIARQEGFYA